MLSNGGVLPRCNSLPPNPISQSLLFPTKTHLSFLLNQVNPYNLPSFHAQIRTGLFSVSASKIPKEGRKPNTPVEMEEINDDDDDDYEDEEGDEEFLDDDVDEEELDEDEGIEIPLRFMKEWVANKPSGFGEGKSYDTSIEDKLVEEIEQSRIAQAANLNKLKNSSQTPNSKKESIQKQNASPSGIRVRLMNLPKKKNIERDLRAAFKEFPGILNIIPAVSGNKKTRDPVCKGLAFVEFKSQNEANRFVELFSGQSILFGKIQKQINCEIINTSSPSTKDEQAIVELPPLTDPSSRIEPNPEIDMPNEDSVDDNVSATRVYTGIFENFSSLDSVDVDHEEQEEEDPASKAELPKSHKQNGAKGKKLVAKRKGGKTPKLTIPGSANRLKIRDKALLTGVFSKYGVKPALPAKEES